MSLARSRSMARPLASAPTLAPDAPVGNKDNATVCALSRRLGRAAGRHIVESALASTGDGLLTALQMAYLLHESGRTLSEMLAPFRRYPQILRKGSGDPAPFE